jgi:ABC-type nitrate/sulfonate/bicarbonate transport system substrate-binding protein
MQKIRVGYASRAVGTAPVWTACDAGYFLNLGLDVEPVLFEGSINVTKALESGEVQLANFAAPAPVQANLERNAGLVVILGAMNRMMQALMGRPGVTSVEDLRGGVIGLNSWGEVNHWMLLSLLPRLGLVRDRDVRLVETGRSRGEPWHTPMPVDALMLHPPEPFAATRAGWTILVDTRRLEIPFQLSCITGRRDWIAANRDGVARYIRGHVEGLLRFNSDREFGLSVMRKWGSPVSEDVQRETWEFASREFSPRPFPTAAAIAGILEAMRGSVPGAESADPAHNVDDSFMRDLEAGGVLGELTARYPQPAR